MERSGEKNPLGFVEHATFMIAGFVLMIVGLGLGVTLIMLKISIVLGLLGFALFVGGFLAHLDRNS